MASVFISHSTQDQEFIEQELIPLLKGHDIKPWYSRESIVAADQWERSILQGLRTCEYFLLVMSPRSARSPWVKREVDWVFNRGVKKIVPVLLEDCDPDDFHIGLAGIQHVDFRQDRDVGAKYLRLFFGVGNGSEATAQSRETTATAKVFLAHATEDKPQIRDIHTALLARGFSPWLDEIDLVPGQDWNWEIEKAIRASDVFLACLSRRSVAKGGYVQRELRVALTVYATKPPGSIYFIPLRLDECELPDHQLPDLGVRLRNIHWLDYWKPNGLQRLVDTIQFATGRTAPAHTAPAPAHSEEQQKLDIEITHRLQPLGRLLEDIFTYTQLHTAKGAILGKPEMHPRVGKLGEFEPLFPEYLNTSLFSLIWQLRQLVTEHERADLDKPLASARELPRFFDRMVLLVPVGEEDSKWQVDRNHIDRLRTVLRDLAITRWTDT